MNDHRRHVKLQYTAQFRSGDVPVIDQPVFLVGSDKSNFQKFVGRYFVRDKAIIISGNRKPATGDKIRIGIIPGIDISDPQCCRQSHI